MALEALFVFAFGLLLLIKGADFFVDAAAKIAKLIGVSDLVIGLTIVAIGTSLPEIAASVFAALGGEPGLAIGTVIGSNIANIALVMAIVAIVFKKIQVEKKALEKDVFVMLLVSVLFFYFSVDGKVSFNEGTILVGIFVVYTLFLLGFMKRFERIFHYERFLEQFFGTEKFSVFNVKTYLQIMKAGIDPATYRVLLGLHDDRFEEKLGKRIGKGEKSEAKQIYKKEFFSSIFNQGIILIFSGIAIYYGALILVDGAIGIANFLGIAKSTIGLFLVAIGTSLPELGVTLSSARKGYSGILIGNIIGSNIANILLVVGTTSVISVLVYPFSMIFIPMFFMLSISFILALFIQRNYDIDRLAGFLFLAVYVVFVYYLSTTIAF